MWQEKLQDTAASHPWLEPHEAIKRKTQAPGMQLVDWYGFTVPKTKKEMFLKQFARREDLLVVGEVDNIHSFFSDYETEWRSNILFDDLDEALRYIEDNIRYTEQFLAERIPQIRAMRPQASFLVWLDCSALGLKGKDLVDLFVDKAHLALNDGEMFGTGGECHMRLNVGCCRTTLEKALRQLEDAVNKNLKKG